MAKPNPDITQAEVDKVSIFPTVKRWLRGKDEDTGYYYSRCMILFTRTTSKNPDEFLAWARTVEPVEVADLIDSVADNIHAPGAKFNFIVDMRSFLRTNGYNNLPKSNLTYTLQAWHRGYRKDEIRKLLGFLDDKLQKFYVYACVETGLRAQTVLDIRYRHVKEDLKAAPTVTQGVVAIRFGPEFFNRKKAAGFTFLGKRSVALLRELIKEGRITENDDAPLIDKHYMTIWKVLNKARNKAGIDKKVQLSHGLRKYFEQGLDLTRPPLDEDRKRILEGHFEGTRGKHYSGREWDDLRPDYVRAYSNIDLDTGDPELEQRLQSWQTEKVELEERIKSLEGELTSRKQIAAKAEVVTSSTLKKLVQGFSEEIQKISKRIEALEDERAK